MNYPDRTHSARVAGEVRAEMARQRVTGTTLALALGVSNATLSRRLSGAIAFDLDELALAAHALGLSVTELLERANRGDAA